MLGFVSGMQLIHNDSLASKGMELTGQALAALLTLMVASKTPSSPGTTETKTTVTEPPSEAEQLKASAQKAAEVA